MEHDYEHGETLQRTGYWGKKAAGCIIVSRGTGRILLTERSQYVLEPLTWGVIGGAIDPGENEKNAVVREVYEEVGKHIDINTLRVLYTYTDNNVSFKYTTYVGTVDTEFEPLLNWENNQTNWFEFGDWPSPMHYGLEAIVANDTASGILKSLCASKVM